MPRPSQCYSCGTFETCLHPGDRYCAEDLERKEIAARSRSQSPKTREECAVMASTISHTRGNVTLIREGAGPNTQWEFVVEGQTSDARQQLVVNSASDLADLKAVIGQVEQAARVLNLDPE